MESRSASLVDVARALVLVQASIAVMTLIEVFVMSATGAPLGAVVLVNAAFAISLLLLVRGIGRRSPRSRRILIWIEGFVLVLAAIDLGLSLLLAQRLLELVPLLTRVVIPLVVFRILRRHSVREEFGINGAQEVAETEEVAA
jgi:hypothetical protein